MTSNEHGAIEQNVEHRETNNLTYYTRQSELHARSYALLNMGTCCRILRTQKKRGRRGQRTVALPIGSGRGAMELAGDGVEEEEAATARETGGRRRRRSSTGGRRRRCSRAAADGTGGGGGATEAGRRRRTGPAGPRWARRSSAAAVDRLPPGAP